MTRLDKILRRRKVKRTCDFALMAEVSRPHASLISRGKRAPSLAVARRIAHALNWPLGDIIFGWALDRRKGKGSKT